MEANYININDLKCEENYVEENIEKYGSDIYQVHPYKDHIIIKHVGKMYNVNDVLINKFSMGNIECYIINTIYSFNDIEKAIDNMCINLYKIDICMMDINKMEKIGTMMTNFIPHTNIPKKSHNIELTENLLNIKGYYIVQLYSNNKTYTLKRLECDINITNILDTMIILLTTPQVMDIYIKKN